MSDQCAVPHCQKVIEREERSYVVVFRSPPDTFRLEARRLCCDCGVKLMRFNEEELETALEDILVVTI